MLKIVTGVLREVRLVSVRQLRALTIPPRYRKQATNAKFQQQEKHCVSSVSVNKYIFCGGIFIFWQVSVFSFLISFSFFTS